MLTHRLAEVLGVLEHLIERAPRVRGGSDDKLLDLLELVHTEDAASVTTVRADLLQGGRGRGEEGRKGVRDGYQKDCPVKRGE
jgi:hypothetical protein